MDKAILIALGVTLVFFLICMAALFGDSKSYKKDLKYEKPSMRPKPTPKPRSSK